MKSVSSEVPAVRNQKRDGGDGSKGKASVYFYAAKVRLIRVSGRYGSGSVIMYVHTYTHVNADYRLTRVRCSGTMATQELQDQGVRPQTMVIGMSFKKSYVYYDYDMTEQCY